MSFKLNINTYDSEEVKRLREFKNVNEVDPVERDPGDHSTKKKKEPTVKRRAKKQNGGLDR